MTTLQKNVSGTERFSESGHAAEKNGANNITLFAIFCTSALLGALFGAVCFCYIDSALFQMLEKAVTQAFDARRSGNMTEIMLSTLSSTVFYIAVSFLLGFSAISQPFEIVLPFLRGISSGVILTMIFSSSLSLQTAAKAAAVFPGTAISLILIVNASREAMFLSNRLFRTIVSSRFIDGLLENVKVYCARFLAFSASVCVISLLDSGLAMLILGKIN